MNMMIRSLQALLLATTLLTAQAHGSLLWKITGNDLERPSYVFGTIHMICEQDFFLDERIEQAFSETETLVMEIDLSAPQTMMQLQQLMVYPQGAYLQDHLSEEQLAAVDEYFIEHFGAGVAQLGVLKPMALNSMVLVAGMPCSDVKSYEVVFADMAEELELTTLELESVEFQMSIFDDIATAEQVEWLWQGINEQEKTQEMLAQMVHAYTQEDLDQLLLIMHEDPQFADHMEVLLDQRNRDWIAPLREMMHAQSAFIAVGAGHLPGDQGVLRLLQEAGYTVEPVTR